MVTTYTKFGDDTLVGNGPCMAEFTWNGTTARAIWSDGSGTQIASGTTPATVLNAAVTAVGAAGGGSISLFSTATTNNGAIPINAPIVLTDQVWLVGAGTTYANGTPYGRGDCVLLATGMTTSQAIIQSTGTSTSTVYGIGIRKIALDGANITQCWDTINAAAPVIAYSQVTRGNPNCIQLRSTLAFPDGGHCAQITNCVIHSHTTSGSGNNISASQSSFGHLKNVTFHVPGGAGGADVGPGWIVSHNHLTGTGTTPFLVQCSGKGGIVHGNYLDTAKAGHNVWIKANHCNVSANYALNGGSTTIGTGVIFLESGLKAVIRGNFCDTTGHGYGVVYGGTGAPPGGSICGNHSNGALGSVGAVDNAGNPIPHTDTGTTYVVGNSMFSGS